MTAPIRVLQVVEASFAGVGRHVIDLSCGLLERGFDVDLAFGESRAEAPFLQGISKIDFGRIERFEGRPSISFRDLGPLRRIRAMHRQGHYDIIHGHASKGGALARLAGGPSRANVVYTPNALVTLDPALPPVARFVYRSFEVALSLVTDALIYVSPEEEAHGTAIGLRPRTSRVIPNGIPSAELPDAATARGQLGLDADTTVIGFVGRLGGQKNVGLLIESFRLAQSRFGPAVQLAIVGCGEEEPRLRHQARPLDASVVFLGRRPGQRAMAAFDVFALPSLYEGFPYVLLEAMHAGVPCVATTGCSAGVLLDDGEAGHLVAPEAPAMADALVRLVNDRRHRLDAGAEARRRASRYNVSAMTEATVDVYHHLLAATRRPAK